MRNPLLASFLVCLTLWLAQTFSGVDALRPQQHVRLPSKPLLPFGWTPPADWQGRVAAAQMMATPNEPQEPQWMPAIANGYLGTVVGSNSTYVAGVYNGRAGETPSHRARIPSTTSITITNANAYASAIDFEKAVFLRRSNATSAQGHTVHIEQRWYAHRVYPHLLVHEIEWPLPSGDDNDDDAAGAQSSSPTTLKEEEEEEEDDVVDDTLTLQLVVNMGAASADINFKKVPPPPHMRSASIWYGQTLITEQPTSERVTVAVCSTQVPSSITAAASGGFLRFLTVIRTSLDSSNPLSDAIEEYFRYYTLAKTDPSSLFDSHKQAWADLWSSGIEVANNLELAQAINSSLYEILSNTRVGWAYGISPGGIAYSPSYNGHIFWDQETWMYPPLLLLFPDLAKNLLQYRHNMIPGARAKAAEDGYKGMMFPWESAFTGQETCPDWAPEGKYEHHISGDIVFALRQYFFATGDTKWLEQIAWPIILGVAQFWESRVSRVQSNDGYYYIINRVIPPDEAAGVVNNSIYTNVICSISLEFATLIGKMLNKTVSSQWLDIARHMKLPFNKTLQIHLEHDNYHGQKINQADVVLLQYPLMQSMPIEIAKNDIAYYQAKTDSNGYFTGDNAYSIAWLGLSNTREAWTAFNTSFLHIKPPFDVWSERVIGGNPHFITGAGGFLQNIAFGYSGIRILNDSLLLQPTPMPAPTQFVRLRKLSYRGSLLDITWDPQHVSVTLVAEAKDTSMWLMTPQQSYHLRVGATVVINTGGPAWLQSKSALPQPLPH